MEDCKLTWHVKPEKAKDMIPAEEAFAGTYNSMHNIVTTFHLWNNRYGKEDVKDLTNYRLALSFGHTEDSSLLKYCHIKVNGSELAGQVSGKQLVFGNMRSISGSANNGVTEDNPSNYIVIQFVFGPATGARLKESDLKDLYFDILRN